MLSPHQLKTREGRLTATRVACLMTGDTDAIMNLWRELIGDPSYMPPDLSGVWAVRLGAATEEVNVDWFARKYGPVSRRGEVVVGYEPWTWMAATLDGWSDTHQCPIEAKHVGGREPLEVVHARYMPQMTWQMLVTRSRKCAISVIMGAAEPLVDFIDLDDDYATELMTRASTFWLCVQSLTPPCAVPPVPPPVKPTVIYNFTGRNEWASAAAAWLETQAAAEEFAMATKNIKSLFPLDGVKAFGHGIVATRAVL